jgi:hypothetical protein
MKPQSFTGDEKIPVNQMTHSNADIGKSNTVRGFTETTIGTTYYDLQTNNAISDRLSVNANNTISAVWTFSPDALSGTPNRGTGYNFFNGTVWGPAPTSRIESQRTGFTNMAVASNGSEHVVSHNNTSFVMQHTYRATAGSGAWTEDLNSLANNAQNGNLWSKTAVNGNSIHSISLTTPVSNGGSLYNGMNGEPLYYRSTNGGSTWDKTNVELPDMNSQNYLGFIGDAYQIDAHNNTVAIVIGDYLTDLLLYKSTDNGETWTKTILMEHPFPLFDDNTITDVDGDGIADNIEVCDGALAVLVDNNDMVHVCWGDMIILNEVTGDGLYSYYPTTNALIYWDESMTAPVAIPNLGSLDLDGSGFLEFPDDGSGGILIGNYGFRGLASYPSFGIDAGNNIYLSYAAAVENSSDADAKAVRHTYVSASTNNGQTWATPIDVVGDLFTEGVYGCLSRTIDENLHLIYQRDFCAGVSTTGVDPCNVGEENEIVYIEMPVSDLGVGACPSPVSPTVFNITATHVNVAWDEVNAALGYKIIYHPAGSNVGLNAKSVVNSKLLKNLTPDTKYKWAVKSMCSNAPLVASLYVPGPDFTTPPLKLGESVTASGDVEVFPNPASDIATISFSLDEPSSVMIRLMDMNGKVMREIANAIYLEGTHQVSFTSSQQSAGVYLLQVIKNDEVVSKKLTIDR